MTKSVLTDRRPPSQINTSPKQGWLGKLSNLLSKLREDKTTHVAVDNEENGYSYSQAGVQFKYLSARCELISNPNGINHCMNGAQFYLNINPDRPSEDLDRDGSTALPFIALHSVKNPELLSLMSAMIEGKPSKDETLVAQTTPH